MSSGWGAWVDGELASVRRAGQWRSPRELDGGGPRFSLDGTSVVSFASNDYLGLSQHPQVVAAAHDALDRWGAGTGAARLVVGSRPGHRALEDALAEWKGCEAAVLFPTGFAANLGVLSVLGSRGVRLVSDERNHASIVDGCRLSRAEVAVYRHGDVDHAADLLKGASRAVVVTDSVFSMDGDLAPLADLGALCAATGALLVVDEAHDVFGVGDAAARHALDAGLVARVGTLSKTLGSLGGFVACSRSLADLLVNRARPYIFTTASTPADCAAASAALAVVRSSEGDSLRAVLRGHVDRVAPAGAAHPSAIVPVVLGSEDRAVAAAAQLLDDELLVPAIRPPTVAPGTSRLRLALSAAHTEADIDALLAGLGRINVG
jgi:8-amino-7-oxononanoate synthase